MTFHLILGSLVHVDAYMSGISHKSIHPSIEFVCVRSVRPSHSVIFVNPWDPTRKAACELVKRHVQLIRHTFPIHLHCVQNPVHSKVFQRRSNKISQKKVKRGKSVSGYPILEIMYENKTLEKKYRSRRLPAELQNSPAREQKSRSLLVYP